MKTLSNSIIVIILSLCFLAALTMVFHHNSTAAGIEHERKKQHALKCQRWQDAAFASMKQEDFGGSWVAAMQGWELCLKQYHDDVAKPE